MNRLGISIYYDGSNWVVTQYGHIRYEAPWLDTAQSLATGLWHQGRSALAFWRAP